MEIHIDTNKDSKEEIRRSIRMLQAYVGERVSESGEPAFRDQFTDTQGSEEVPDASPGMFNMFSGNSNDNDKSDEYPQTYDEEDKEPDTPRVQIVEY